LSSCFFSFSQSFSFPSFSSSSSTSFIIQGVETRTTEVVAQADAIGISITSGGGFSFNYPRPSWQDKAVAGYFAAAAAAKQSPPAGYNANGRGFPDISLAGVNYDVYIGGNYYPVSGTSASCPAVAGFISTINAARIALGKGSIGFLNPALYAYGSSFTNDIKSGNIFCTGDDGTCCPQGYYAAPGWDPTTGFGSVNYGKMASVLTALGSTIVPTSSPVVAPTPVPITAPLPAPVAVGSPLSGYFISASYLDSTCGALRFSTSKLLNACDRNFDSTSSYYTATSTEFITKSYTDTACKSNERVTREAYTGLCSGSLKRYVSGAPDPPSTAPAVYYRSVHSIPSLISLSHKPFLPLYIIYPSCLSLNYITLFLFLSR
jgi:hypothetical protein